MPTSTTIIQHSIQAIINELSLKVGKSSVFIVTDENVEKFYLSKIQHAIPHCSVFSQPSGEAYKTLEQATKLWMWLLENKADRKSILIGLGGGVITDLTGFVASTYFRGMRSYYIPTSVIAQADAAFGGKTGVNLPQGKNMVGTFYEPDYIFIAVETLLTLPDRHFTAGLAEIVKCALIGGEAFFTWLEEHCEAIRHRDITVLQTMITKALDVKQRCIENDLTDERGKRAKLNLGHTFAHALEAYGQYERWLHGEAVSIGLLFDLVYSVEINQLKRNILHRTKDLLQKLRLPTYICGAVDSANFFRLMQSDKKMHNRKTHTLVVRQIGDVVLIACVCEQDMCRFTAKFIKSHRRLENENEIDTCR